MRKLGLAALVSLMMWCLLPVTANAQIYTPPEKATPKGVYCSGFIAGSALPNDLRLIGGCLVFESRVIRGVGDGVFDLAAELPGLSLHLILIPHRLAPFQSLRSMTSAGFPAPAEQCKDPARQEAR